jgi:DNA polymerase III subunit delta
MKLQPRDAPGYFARAEPPRPGLLIYGEDAMRVALKRQEVILAMIGAQGESEMRLTRIDGADARKDPALVGDAMKATGFFPGPRAVLVDEATDSLTDAVAAALDDWREGDACLVVTAGKQLPPSSRLRKLFEARPDVWCAAIYNDPPSRAEIETVLKRAGAGEITREGMAEIEALSRALDPGDFRQTIEKLALYKYGDPTPVTPDDVAAAPPPRPKRTWTRFSTWSPRPRRRRSARFSAGSKRRGSRRSVSALPRAAISVRFMPPPPIPRGRRRRSPAGG